MFRVMPQGHHDTDRRSNVGVTQRLRNYIRDVGRFATFLRRSAGALRRLEERASAAQPMGQTQVFGRRASCISLPTLRGQRHAVRGCDITCAAFDL